MGAWEEEAKNYKSSGTATATAPNAENDDWKVWQATAPDSRNGIQKAFDNLTTITPEQDAHTPAPLKPLAHFGAGAIEGFGAPFVHPLQTLGAVGNAIIHPIDTASGMWQSAKDDPAKMAGNLTGNAVLGGAAHEMMPRGAPPVKLSPVEDATRNLATRLTPSAKEAPGVQSTLANQIDTLKRTAPEGKLSRTQGLLDLSKTAGEAAENDPYLKEYIEPNRDMPTGDGSTVGEDHAELARLNAELYPKYMKGGSGSPAAQAAISTERAAAIEARANILRQRLANAVGNKMGLDPEYVRGLRKNYEQLRDIGWRADVADYAHQMGLRDPAIPTSKLGIFERGYNRFFNNPNNSVARVFNNYEAAPAELPKAQFALSEPKPVTSHPVSSQPYVQDEIPAKLNPAMNARFTPRPKAPIPEPVPKPVASHPTDTSVMLSEPQDVSGESRQYLNQVAQRRAGRTKSAAASKEK